MKYKLEVNGISSVSSITPVFEDFKNYIKVVDSSDTVIQDLSNIVGLSTREPNFTARVNTSSAASSLGQPGIKIADNSNNSKVVITYNLGGENVKYYLSDDYGATSTGVIKIENTQDSFLGVKVIGSLQGTGKQTITGQKSNFSDISKIDVRTSIRKNAYTFIKNMSDGQILNGIRYKQGDVTLSGTVSGYETLVVKNGNVIISGDLNTENNKLGIIVLKDGYNVNTDYGTQGNVYVTSGVKKINAIIYADGGFISYKNSGDKYFEDSTSRTSDLQNQLIMKGTLFTRNTIGGAILAGGKYILPGGSQIDDFDTAMIYDLNYIRRGNVGCSKNSDSDCTDTGEYKDPFVIKYDSTAQTNPPKLFGN